MRNNTIKRSETKRYNQRSETERYNQNTMRGKKYLQLNDIDAYKQSFHLSNYVWDLVITWEWFAKKTVGDQFVRAADSISANIAEGFGRYHKKDKIKFYRYSQGSLKESFDWAAKSKKRELINEEQYQYLLVELKKIDSAIYRFIRFTNERLKE